MSDHRQKVPGVHALQLLTGCARRYQMADDGTVWFYSDGLGIWTGWVPGEDGCWTYTDEEMARHYPEIEGNF